MLSQVRRRFVYIISHVLSSPSYELRCACLIIKSYMFLRFLTVENVMKSVSSSGLGHTTFLRNFMTDF